MAEQKKIETYVSIEIREQVASDCYSDTTPDEYGLRNVRIYSTFLDPTCSTVQELMYDALRAAGFLPGGR